MANDVGKSRIEAILENALGADNEILEPFSRNEVLLLRIADKLDATPDTPISSAEIDSVVNSIE